MPSSYTTSLRLTLPANGELAGSWGSTVNTGVTSLAEAAIAGTAAVAMTDADYTLTVLNGGDDQARNMFITLTGTLTAARNVICPSVSKLYVVTNNTTGSQTITFKTAAGSGIAVANGQRKMLYCNGTNVLDATTGFTSLLFDAGTAGAPSIAFAGNASTGFWLPTTSTLAASTAGVERLRLDASGFLGVGKTPSLTQVDIQQTSTYALGVSTATRNYAFRIDSGFADALVLGNRTSSTDLLWLTTGGNLGIGTASPARKLDVNGPIRIADSTVLEWGGTTVAINGASSTNTLTFATASTERMRLDASGNLGIGTTSTLGRLSVQTAAGSSLNVRDSLAVTGVTGAMLDIWNTPAAASSVPFAIRAADFRFGTDSAGTFVERLRIDSSGNLGVGTGAPSSYGNTGRMVLQTSSSTDGIVATFANSGSTGAGIQFFQNAVSAAGIGMPAGSGGLTFAPSGTTEKMRLDTAGNLGIGVTPSVWGVAIRAIDVSTAGAIAASSNAAEVYLNSYYNGTSFIYKNTAVASKYEQSLGAHKWFNAPSGTAGNPITFTQAMTLDENGDLMVGTTSSTLVSGYAARLNIVYPGSTTKYGIALRPSTDTTTSIVFCRADGLAIVGSITQTASATAYNTTSDQRLKDNIQNAPEASDLIDAIQVRSFDWKADGSHQRYGFVAQELVTVAPEAVSAPADPDEMMAVDYSKLVPMLVKEIQSLRARVATMEAAWAKT